VTPAEFAEVMEAFLKALSYANVVRPFLNDEQSSAVAASLLKAGAALSLCAADLRAMRAE
jgi:hypothetical protein